MTMICSKCGGGRVEWQGRLSDLTHTKCLSCGAINSQKIEPPEEENSIAEIEAMKEGKE